MRRGVGSGERPVEKPGPARRGDRKLGPARRGGPSRNSKPAPDPAVGSQVAWLGFAPLKRGLALSVDATRGVQPLAEKYEAAIREGLGLCDAARRPRGN